MSVFQISSGLSRGQQNTLTGAVSHRDYTGGMWSLDVLHLEPHPCPEGLLVAVDGRVVQLRLDTLEKRVPLGLGSRRGGGSDGRRSGLRRRLGVFH